ncbi:hypothetical protein NLG97_g2009 [Lecanicillium saksenae]|uniref:Uncharacterized protein n=1 Tax=Lecanicillium saksenae TaxID=468837 RepID=A0ACC1R2B8_9HYPO|nr:hypothetical protein NLG97_g2009 [Lecanicillium saksenae]
MECTSRQTRFHHEATNRREICIDGIHIAFNGQIQHEGASEKAKLPSKARGRAPGTEILKDAELRLQEGLQYNLVGRNGTGKSTILRAIAEKLIPGMPQDSRIAFLNQLEMRPDSTTSCVTTTLQQVINSVTEKNSVEKDIRRLSEIIALPSPYDALRGFRHFKFDKMQHSRDLLQKEANMRSGGRGLAARRELAKLDKDLRVAADALSVSDDDISSNNLKEENQEAADVLMRLHLQYEPTDQVELTARAKRFLLGLGFTDAMMNQPLSSLSGGWKMRASLAAALLQDADILILDEPTNFLDIFGIIWLQRHLVLLRDTPKPPTVLLVSHDRAFTDICTDLILLKERAMVYFHGTLGVYEAAQSERRVWLVSMKAAQDKQRAHMEKTIAQNLKAGKEKNDQNKIRQAKSRQLRLDERLDMGVNFRGGKVTRSGVATGSKPRADLTIPPEERPLLIVLPPPQELRFPGSLISLENAHYKYHGSATAVVRNITLTISMGDRIGILGLNGAGKSTLIRMLVGQASPSQGTINMHPRLKVAYYAQDAVKSLRSLADESDGSITALSLLLREVNGSLTEGDVRGLLGHFGLPGRIASDVPISKLSGGQLVRCELARLLWPRPHCLIMDEVTTHLDSDTVAALRDALRAWPGAVVLISHDRWFMRGVVEGQLDEGEEGQDGEMSDGDEHGEDFTRRSVYKLDKGELFLLQDGVDEFERSIERRISKFL